VRELAVGFALQVEEGQGGGGRGETQWLNGRGGEVEKRKGGGYVGRGRIARRGGSRQEERWGGCRWGRKGVG
jgi:hypothetical protein